MKVLYAIQGTGNGHISRACEIVPILRKMADIDVFISGSNSNLKLPFPVKYESRGLSFKYGKKGNIDISGTLGEVRLPGLVREILSLPVQQYDLIINDFELISAWAGWWRNVPCISLSHQAALWSKHAPKPEKKSALSEYVLRKYAPCNYAAAFHFESYDDYIYTPVIRKEIRNITPTNGHHITVYLPAVSDAMLVQVLSALPKQEWEVFSTKAQRSSTPAANIRLIPANHKEFQKSLSSSAGLLCGAGFESPAEALFLGKKLFVIPIRGQYEQLCNAAALAQMGVSTAQKFDLNTVSALRGWLEEGSPIHRVYPDLTEGILEQVLYCTDHYLAPQWT